MLELKNVSYTVKAGQDSYDDRDHDIIRQLSLTVEEGKLIVIDGGFCHAYHKTTGIAGYTLIFNSHGLRLKAHRPFTTIEDALLSNTDIHSDSYMVETFRKRMMVGDSDAGTQIRYSIRALTDLLQAYRSGEIAEN